MNKKRAQISTEYLVVVGFVVLVVITILGVALFYTTQIQDTVKFDQLEKAARKIIFAAETTFYDGEPAKSTIEAYFPEGIESVSVDQDEQALVFTVSSSSGTNIIAFPSSVPIQGTLPSTSGLKKIQVTAQSDHVAIAEATT